MKPGTKPTPTALKKLRGTARPDRVNANEPKPRVPAKTPRVPRHLNDRAKKYWRREAKKLHAVGILTEVDLLVQLADLLGAGVSGVRVTIRVPDRLGEFAKITSAVASRNWGIYASGGLPTPKRPETWDIVIKVRHAPKEELIDVLQSIEGQQVIDVRET